MNITAYQRHSERLKILSFDQSIFLSKAKIMYKIKNYLAPTYLNEMFLMGDANLDNTSSNLRSFKFIGKVSFLKAVCLIQK